jgi:predicted phosphodiesterase
MNRRTFLQKTSLLAGAAYLDAPAFAQALDTLGRPNIIIGVLSDIHIRDAQSANTFQHALEYFRDQKVDGVIMAGDLADWGLEPQLQVVADTWFRVFPDDKLPGGEHVEKLFVYGNHDMDGYTWGRVDAETSKAQGIGLRPAEVWKTCFREDYSPIWLKTVKGYHFIGAHWHAGNIPGLGDFLNQHVNELGKERPFFYIQHPHLKNTCNGPWAWGQDDGTVTKLFSQWPNAVCFSGHSHSPLNDERDLWQGSFTSIGTASLSYLYPMPARENTYQDDSPLKPPYQMANMNCSDGRQGMVMRVYDNCITMDRREFVYDQQVGDNWVLPWPISRVNPLSFENRGKVASVPQFPSDARATLTQARGKDRYGKEQQQVTVHFPNVLTKQGGVRAFDYEVQVEYQWLDVIFVSGTKRVFSPKCYLGEAQDQGEVICIFGEGELPKDRPFRFAIRPCECFGAKGEPIYTDWTDGSIVALTSAISTKKKFFRVGEEIGISFQDAPEGSDAWIGIYTKGTDPGANNPSKTWQYTKTRQGNLSFTLQQSGEYYAVLFRDSGYSECSSRIPILVTNRTYDETAFVMKPDKTAYKVGDPVHISLTAAPCMSKDWIGIYAQGVTPQDVKCPTWLYANKANETLTLNVSGTRNWTSPLPEGVYFLGYFMCDGYTEPFPRRQFVVGQPVQLYTELQGYSTSDEVLIRCEGVPTALPCRLCYQKDGETEWHEAQALGKTDETLSLGRLEAGEWHYCVQLDGTPISRVCSFTVKSGESAVGRVSTSRRDAEIFRLDGRRAERSLSQLPRGIYIQGGTKVLR